MKENKLTIRINKPVSRVFQFTLDPHNTHKWIDFVVKEETNEWPIRLGSIYKNQNTKGRWSTFTVTALKTNELFELTSQDENLHVRYSYKSITKNVSELEYYDWVDQGQFDSPITLSILEKLKLILEKEGN